MVQMVNVTYGTSKATTNALGQRPMQARTYAARAAQFLLLKAPPAAGKSRALMFVALDKLRHQGLGKVILCVPGTSIGGSFRSTDLTSYGFEADWEVDDRWNLCLTGEDADKQKVKAFQTFMESDAKVLVCTHATFRFGFDEVIKTKGIEAFDSCFIAIDEFHHVFKLYASHYLVNYGVTASCKVMQYFDACVLQFKLLYSDIIIQSSIMYSEIIIHSSLNEKQF